VETGKNGYKGLQYARFVPILVEGLKAMHEQLQETRIESEELKATVASLSDRLNAIEELLE